MTATFTLIAIPWLLSEREHKGHLEFLTFIATDGGYSKKWTATNVGTFVEDFAKIIPAGNAQAIVERLWKGETVMFPGFFELDDLLHRFGGTGNE